LRASNRSNSEATPKQPTSKQPKLTEASEAETEREREIYIDSKTKTDTDTDTDTELQLTSTEAIYWDEFDDDADEDETG
jgi:hypothetical protein